MQNTLLLLLQAGNVATEGPDSLSILGLLASGGWAFMIPLGILSVMSVYIFIERLIAIKKAKQIDKDFMSRIRENMINGNIRAAADLCRNTDSPIARMIEKGIMRIGKPLRSIEVAIENVGKLELFRLENHLSILATIAGLAPMIGFLGTVTGMIQAFFRISQAGANVDPSMLAGGIYQALVTTATGLAIGIIALFAYNYLVSQVEKVVHKMEATTVEFLDLLQEPAK